MLRCVIILLVSIFVLLGLTACSSVLPTVDAGPTQPLPLYPAATTVTIEPLGPSPLEQETTFDTTDDPPTILAFYRSALVTAGWKITQTGTPRPYGLDFEWAQTSNAPAFAVTIIATPKTRFKTAVYVRVMSVFTK